MQIIRRNTAKAPQLDPEIEKVYGSFLASVLKNRNILNVEEASTQAKYLQHFEKMCDIQKAASLLADAVINADKLVIVGDFDADGATSTALCILALKDMGYHNVDYIIPNRFDYGYGLTNPVVDLAVQKNADLIMTVDNGISSIEAVDYAKQQELKVIITDHHLPSDELPKADAIVNPNQHSCGFTSKNLAGVGVAFYLLSALKHELHKRDYFSSKAIPTPNLANFLDIVALGTVADVVPLDRNNRILVHQGIQRIRSGKTRPGILALLQATNRDYRKCSTSDIGFAIAPRLNAAGRLEDMSQGIECLICDCPLRAADIAAALDGLNQSRREIEQSMREDAEKSLEKMALSDKDLPNAIVVYREDFHQGVIGIVAGRLKEKYYRPTVVFAEDDAGLIKGSARSIDGVHIRDVFARMDTLSPNLLIKYGGHAMAAGLTIKKQNLETFTSLLSQIMTETYQELPTQAIVYSDGELSEQELTLENAHALKYLMPWGQKFEEPVFDGEFEVVKQRIVGQNHLKLVVAKNKQIFDAIAFNVDTKIWPNESIRKLKLAYKLDVNEFRGQSNLQLMVSALEPV